MQPKIGFIGLGKVGYTLARLLHQANYNIVAVYNRNNDRALQLTDEINTSAVSSFDELVTLSDLIIMTVSDDAITDVVVQLSNLNFQNKAVIHTSGAKSIIPLQPLLVQGAMIGSFHPAFPFTSTAISSLQGVTFAIEANHERLQSWLEHLVQALNGQIIIIPDGKKALYHTALVIASNYTVTLYAIAQKVLNSIGAQPDAINGALQTLMQATVNNIADKGIPDALTGPLVRADSSTIQAHLHAMEDELVQKIYIQLAQLSLPMVQQRAVDTHILETILQDANETLDNP